MIETTTEYWLDEPVADLYSDPVYALMREQGDEEELEDPRLAARQQVMLFRELHEDRVEQQESVDVASVLQRRFDRAALYFVLRIKRGECKIEDALTQLQRMGCSYDEAIDMLLM
jgi:hypothetical protein